MINSTIDVEKYALRFGEGTAANGDAETYRVEKCALKSDNVENDATIVLRGTADQSTLTIVDTTIEAAVSGLDIQNTAIGATIVK